jgi:hypothetical protein
MTTSKISRAFTITGCTLLLIMAFLHGSGIVYVNNLMQESNAEDFLKEIFPVLFANPSIQLFGLAILGILTLFMKHEKQKILGFIFAFVCVDAGLAFYLSATIPGILLLFAALTFGFAGLKQK